MIRKIFLAGASGAVGKRLAPLLLEAGYAVTGTTRSAEKAASLRQIGVEPAIVDVFDAEKLAAAVVESQPDVVIHQLTDLPYGVSPAAMKDFIGRNARIRSEGTANLVRAAKAVGVRRMIVQSIAWAYAPKAGVFVETDPLDLHAEEPRATTVGGVATMEQAVLREPGMDGIVLRYGFLYGPGTGVDMPANPDLRVHVDAAAVAALKAVERGAGGIYNVTETDVVANSGKARDVLGWDAAFRINDRQ